MLAGAAMAATAALEANEATAAVDSVPMAIGSNAAETRSAVG